jgi:pyruvyl transferase EpsO
MEGLKKRIDGISPLIGKRRIAYLDYPMYGNIGDLLIMIGNLAFFRKNRFMISSSMTAFEVNRRPIPADDVIILQGGGNFGDLYPLHQDFRESIIRRHKENRILVFPQTLFFRSDEKYRKTCGTLSGHPDLHIFCRDSNSHELARRMTKNVYMMPDTAHYLWGESWISTEYPESDAMTYGKLALLRTDQERKPVSSPDIEADKIMDWPSLVGKHEAKIALMKKVWKTSRRLGLECRLVDGIKLGFWQNYARRLIEDAVKEFRRARMIVTDRLHGHILACLMSKKHELLDNSYGKLFKYHDAWTAESPLVARVERDINTRTPGIDGYRP